MDRLVQDVRHALRLLRKSPGFSLIVVATLALGIGANTAIFSLLDQLLLRLLPVKDPKSLVLLSGPGPNQGFFQSTSDAVAPFSHPMFLDFRERGGAVFSGVLAQYPVSFDVAEGGGTERATGALVSGTYFELLGVGAAAGRVLTPDDDRTPGAHPVAVLSHGYWLRRFGGDPSVLGRVLRVNGVPLTVVGVAAAGFHGTQIGRGYEVFVPLMMKPQMTPTWNGLGDRRSMWLEVMARLRPGVSVAQAEAAMAVVYRQALEGEARDLRGSQKFLSDFVSKKLEFLPGGQGLPELQKRLETPLLVLTGMVGLVVLIACANVANLLLARAWSRQREIAVRLAIGASRRHLVRQLLVESLVLSLLGAAAGLPLAALTTGALLRALPFEGVALTLSGGIDVRVALYALGLAVLTAVLVGLVPALQATRPSLVTALKEEGGAVAGASGALRFRKGLVVAQVALSALLLVGAGLFTRSLSNLRALDPGFRSEGLLTFSYEPGRSGYSVAATQALLERVRARLAELPGVRAVSMAENALMTESIWQSTVHVEGYTAGEGENMNPRINGVGPAFFATVGMPLVAGRQFDERDVLGAGRVAVVNEVFAKKYFRDANPVGRRIGFGRDEGLPIEIVGVVRDARLDRMREEPQRFVFLPAAQQPDITGVVYYVRTDGDPAALAAPVRAAVRAVDAALPVTDVKTMTTVVDESLFTDRIVAGLSAAFGLLATLLAAVGLYGVMSYAVARRTREIGVRVALGADQPRILKLVLGEIAILSGIGMAIGLPGGWGLGRVVESRLFGLRAFDPPTLLFAAAVLAAATLLAGLLPALRALRVEPSTALRYE
ncbi:MAG: ABC transporter permease [Vicinamibacteria bacterium]